MKGPNMNKFLLKRLMKNKRSIGWMLVGTVSVCAIFCWAALTIYQATVFYDRSNDLMNNRAYHLIVQDADEDTYQYIQSLGESSYSWLVGSKTEWQHGEKTATIRLLDQPFFNESNVYLYGGEWPSEKGELMLDYSFALEHFPNIRYGDRLSFTDEEHKENIYKITGLFNGYEQNVHGLGIGNVDTGDVYAHVSGVDVAELVDRIEGITGI